MDPEELRETFDYFDADHNGRIDRDEFRQLLDALGAGVDQGEADTGFDIIDLDNNGTISLREFTEWWSDRG